MSAYHLEIRAADGRTICAVDAEVRKVGDIDAVRSADTVAILINGEGTAAGYPTVDQAKRGGFELYRWPLGQESEPVVTKIK